MLSQSIIREKSRAKSRENFDSIIKELPSLKTNPYAPIVSGTLSNFFKVENSVASKTMKTSRTDRYTHSKYQTSQATSTTFEVPSYYYDGNNLFDRRKQDRSNPIEPPAFHLT